VWAADPDAPPFDLELYRDGDSYLRPTLSLEAAIFAEKNAWHGESRSVVGDHVGYWWEWAVTAGLEGALELGDYGLVFARASGIGARSQGVDAAGSNVDDPYDGAAELEDLVLGWRSGGLFPRLGDDALELSVGKQRYEIGDGFFLLDGAGDGGERGAFWLAPRKAFYMSAIARLTSGPYKAELFYLRPNDQPFSASDVLGGNFEYLAGETGTVGFTYLKVLDSQEGARSGLNLFAWRAALTPLALDRSFGLGGEYAIELNGSQSNASAWHVEASYEFESLGWKPFARYRYAHFSGDRRGSPELELWDPLFYGYSDWSSWYIGEIIGNFVAQNRDLATHTVWLRVQPIEAVTTQLIYNYYSLVEPVTVISARDANPRAANIRSNHVGQSFDFVTDWSATSYLSFSGVVSALDPGAGMQQYVESDSKSWWLHFMLYAKVSF
jgi:hypothetical protein